MTRVYQEWQGNEVFFCGGRLVAGPNWKSLLGTSLLILIPLAVYALLVGEVLMDELHFAVPMVGLILGAVALVFLFTTGCMDPGILKRQEPDEDYLTGRKPKTNEVLVNGHRVLVRYNETCHFYQPPRAHHCSVNDNCVKKFDHHCPWVGTTIGLRNYRFFLSFIFAASLLCIYICATSVLAIKLEYDNLDSDERDLKKAFAAAPAAIVVAGYAALFFLFVGGLSFFHIYLVSTNQTTYENFRYGYDRSNNPYDEGCLMNCLSVWCTPIPPSDINYRAPVVRKSSRPSSIRNSREDASSSRGATRRKSEVEMGSYGQGINLGDESQSDWGSSSPPQSVGRYQAGSRESGRAVHYMQRPMSAIGPVTDSIEIQVQNPTSSRSQEPPNNLRRYHSEGQEIRRFPGYASTAFRPTTMPHQDGVTPRPRQPSQIPRRPR